MNSTRTSNTSALVNEETLTLLSQINLFSSLPRGELKYLAYTLDRLSLPPDTVIFREDEVGDSFYILIAGKLEVVMGMDTPDEKILATYGPGQYVGEMSLVNPESRRSASIRTRDYSQLWVMTREDFDELLHRHPHVAYSMAKVMSDRLRNSDSTAFTDLREKNRLLQAAYDELKAAQQQIIEKEKLEKELQLAAEIQMSILPRQLPSPPGADFGGYMDPARSVGGDFYDVFEIEPGRIGVVIGDVADKGVPSAIFMARAHALLVAEGLRGGTPGQVLQAVNAYLTRFEQGDLFVTVIYGIYEAATGRFSYARAGHELPLLLSAPGQVAELPRQSSLALGIFDQMPLDEHSLELPHGGALLFFTDGLSDCRNPAGIEFGREQIVKTLAGVHGLSAQAACDHLTQTLLDFRQHAAQDDDVTLVLIHRS